MTLFTITEDFLKNEIEFDQRFSDPNACYDYLFKQKLAQWLYLCAQLNRFADLFEDFPEQ